MLHIDTFENRSKLSTWLCTIARNEYYKHVRKNPRAEPISEGSLAWNKAIWNEKEDFSVLYQCIHRLENPYQEILFLRIFANLPYQKIAEIFGRSENWARVMFYRAKDKLRKEMEP